MNGINNYDAEKLEFCPDPETNYGTQTTLSRQPEKDTQTAKNWPLRWRHAPVRGGKRLRLFGGAAGGGGNKKTHKNLRFFFLLAMDGTADDQEVEPQTFGKTLERIAAHKKSCHQRLKRTHHASKEREARIHWATTCNRAQASLVDNQQRHLEETQLAFFLLSGRSQAANKFGIVPLVQFAEWLSGHLMKLLDCQPLTLDGMRVDYLVIAAELDARAGRGTPSFRYKTPRILTPTHQKTPEAEQAAFFPWGLRNAQTLVLLRGLLYVALFSIPELRRCLVDGGFMTDEQHALMWSVCDREDAVGVFMTAGEENLTFFNEWAAGALIQSVPGHVRGMSLAAHPLLVGTENNPLLETLP